MTAAAACIVATSPAHAAEETQFDVPAGQLNVALITFATQARVSVETSDPALRSVRVRGVKGRYSVREGLRRLLQGTGYDFAISSNRVIRVFPRKETPPPKPPLRPSLPAPAPVETQTEAPPQTIIVTATKQNAALSDYPGSIHVGSFEQSQTFRFGGQGSEVLLREIPNLNSTGLGSGRNKIFIRGISDSSFNGQSQSTISQYLGESRLIYNAPDPDLALYDIARVEVLEGPQGTLYGAGSLGGVIRIVPREPQVGKAEISGTGAVSTTRGELGTDGAAVANVPLGDNAAVRVIGYLVRRPGYIDDLERGLTNINRTNITGMRATLRFEPSDDLSFDLGVVSQNTASRDGQYTDSGTSALTRRSFVAQPFDNNFRLAFVTAKWRLGWAQLVSNTTYTDHTIDTEFDATSPADQVPALFEEVMWVKLLTHETRLSGASGALKSWVLGASVAKNITSVERLLGAPENPPVLSSGHSEILDTALFGEATAQLWRTFYLTAGGRLSWVRQVEEFIVPEEAAGLEPSRASLRLLPTAAFSWKPWRGWIVYARYQEGFRPGAQQLTNDGGQMLITRFAPDKIRTTELGLRFGSRPGARFSGSLSYAYSRWSRVQADLVSPDGFPYVANLGSGYVRYTSAEIAWRPMPELTFEASGFLAASNLDRPAPDFIEAAERDLPNMTDSGWRLSARYAPRIDNAKLTFEGSIGYVGSSSLAIGAPFDFTQGGYREVSLGARADFDGWGLSLDVENLLDSRENRFSYGNPFSLASGNQQTPLRPRTVRIGVDASF